MIGFQDASKYYYTQDGVRVVLHEASLLFERTVRLALFAQPGSGKSLIARMLAGIENPSSGTVLPAGGDCWRLNDSTVLQPYLTGEQNIRIIAELKSVDPDKTSAFVMDFSELGDRYFDSLQTYSSSMRGRLGFALSMALPVDFFVADQGIQVGIGRYRDKCETILKERLENAGIFVVTSNPSFAKITCDSFAVLRNGQFVPCDSYSEAIELFQEGEDEFDAIRSMIAAYGRNVTD
tara:strand:+ start:3677 stop:4384 length:708 start_codon:yes stop_codon:yes gene_type:complete